MIPNEISGANAAGCCQFSMESKVVFSQWPRVAQLFRSA
jgi:hypothetical protein